ncbi:MAG: hypothetical protein ACRDGR_09725, partial [bacterium]
IRGGPRRSPTLIRFRNERRLPDVVDERLQKRIVVAACWPIAVGSVISLGALLLFGVRAKELVSQIDLVALAPPFLSTAILFVAAIVLQVLLAMRLAQRIGGSAYRITKTLQAFRLGEKSERVSLRRGDPHGILAGEVNGFLDWVTRETTAASARRPFTMPPDEVRTRTPTR